MNKFSGKLIYKSVPEVKTSKAGKEYKIMEFVLEEVKDEYPQSMCIKAFGERCDAINNIEVGSFVTVLFDCKATQFNERYYNNITLFKIEPTAAQSDTAVATPATAPAPASAPVNQQLFDQGSDDGLPF